MVRVGESDEALMSAYRAGDVRAFELLVARHDAEFNTCSQWT